MHSGSSVCTRRFTLENSLFSLPIQVAERSKVRMCWCVADHRLGLRVGIPPGAYVSVSGECCALSLIRPCKVAISRPEDLYRLLWSKKVKLSRYRPEPPGVFLVLIFRG